MIETIIVVLVVGIFSAKILTRVDGVTKRNVPDQADLLRRDLRHIQSLALTYGIALRLNVTTTGYIVCLATAPRCELVSDALIDPSTSQSDPNTSQRFVVTLPPGLTMTALDFSSVAAPTVDFDSIGRPTARSTLIATNPVRTFAVTGASKTSYVYLRPITGFAEVSY